MYYYLTHNDQTIENGGHVVFVVESRDAIERLTAPSAWWQRRLDDLKAEHELLIVNNANSKEIFKAQAAIEAHVSRPNCRMPQWVGKPIYESATPVGIWRTTEEQISEAQSYLKSTSYIAEKIAEAQLHGRNTASLKTEYSAVLAKREEARALIRKLQGKAAETALSALPAAPVPAAPASFPKIAAYVEILEEKNEIDAIKLQLQALDFKTLKATEIAALSDMTLREFLDTEEGAPYMEVFMTKQELRARIAELEKNNE